MKRVLLALAVVVVLAVAGVVWWGLRSLNGIVTHTIEDVGSDLLGTRVSVSGVSIDLRRGTATIRGLQVANPTGPGLSFSSEPALRLGEISAGIDLRSLGKQPLVLTRIRISKPYVNAEVTPGGINLDLLRNRVEAASASGGKGGSKAPTSASGKPVRLLVQDLRFEDGRVRADTSKVGGETQDVDLPPLRMRDVGSPGGTTPEELGKRVLSTYLRNVTHTVAREQLGRQVDQQLGGVKEKAGEALRGLLGGSKQP